MNNYFCCGIWKDRCDAEYDLLAIAKFLVLFILHYKFYYRAMICVACLCFCKMSNVHPSVTRRYSVEATKRVVKLLSPF